MVKKKKHIVLFGGGKGLSELVRGFMHYPEVRTTAVVAMSDDGGSSGDLRKKDGVLPPGDIRRVLLAASDVGSDFSNVWEHRFHSGPLQGHVVGNLVLAEMQKRLGAEQAFAQANAMLGTRVNVVPATTKSTQLVAELVDGKKIVGETHIDIPKKKRAAIKRVYLSPAAKMPTAVRDAVLHADGIVFGPGDFYTSLLPTLLTAGMRTALARTKAHVVYTCNLFTKQGETDGYTVVDFFYALEQHVGKKVVNAIVVNTGTPTVAQLREEKNKHREVVRFDRLAIPRPVQVVQGSFIGLPSLYANGRLYAKKIISLIGTSYGKKKEIKAR